MARFIRVLDGDDNRFYLCDNGKKYRAIEILDNQTIYENYKSGECRQVHVDELDGNKFVHTFAVCFNSDYAKQYPDLFPQAYDDAFNQLWEVSGPLYE